MAGSLLHAVQAESVALGVPRDERLWVVFNKLDELAGGDAEALCGGLGFPARLGDGVKGFGEECWEVLMARVDGDASCAGAACGADARSPELADGGGGLAGVADGGVKVFEELVKARRGELGRRRCLAAVACSEDQAQAGDGRAFVLALGAPLAGVGAEACGPVGDLDECGELVAVLAAGAAGVWAGGDVALLEQLGLVEA